MLTTDATVIGKDHTTAIDCVRITFGYILILTQNNTDIKYVILSFEIM